MDYNNLLLTYTRGRQAYQEAEKQIPDRWYEAVYVLYVIAAPLMYVLLVMTLSRYYFSPPRWLAIVGTLIYFSGWLVDTITTHESMKLRPDFDRRHIHYPSYETNPLTRETPHLILQLLSPSTLMAILVLLVSWFALPAMGIAMGIVHMVAGVANNRHTQRMQLNLELFDSLAEDKAKPPPKTGEKHTLMY